MPHEDLVALDDPGMTETDVDDPGGDTPVAPIERTPRLKVAPGETRNAVTNVLELLGRPSPTTPVAGRSVLPSARARTALETLANYANAEAFAASAPNLKTLTSDLLDWADPHGPTRATTPVVKTVGKILLASNDAGVSLYPQAVEMLSLASAGAPLLQPDRIARLLDLATQVHSAFAPERYTMQLAGALRTVLHRYPEQRREQLLGSLWLAAHEGRWWDMTSGVVKLKVGSGKTTDTERLAAADTMVREILTGATEGSPEAHAAVSEALVSQQLAFNPGTQRLVAGLPESDELAAHMTELATRMRHGDTVDPDQALFASLLSWLSPTQRPETPLTWLVRTLVDSITPDPDTGVVAVEALPEKPREFRDLYPLAELLTFPAPNSVRQLDRSTMVVNGTPLMLEWISNPAELAANRDYMGNCTWSYKDRLEAGTYVLFRVWDGGDCYNAAFQAHTTGWALGEMNSRFNGGNVPEPYRSAMAALAAQLPAPQPVGERVARIQRDVRYHV